MAVTLADIKKLRDITGAGMMDVKKALEEANGDFEVAKDLLRKRGQAIAAKRSDLIPIRYFAIFAKITLI